MIHWQSLTAGRIAQLKAVFFFELNSECHDRLSEKDFNVIYSLYGEQWDEIEELSLRKEDVRLDLRGRDDFL